MSNVIMIAFDDTEKVIVKDSRGFQIKRFDEEANRLRHEKVKERLSHRRTTVCPPQQFLPDEPLIG